MLYLAATNPLVTGLLVHEWLGLGVFVVFAVHTAANLDTVFQAVRRKTAKTGGMSGDALAGASKDAPGEVPGDALEDAADDASRSKLAARANLALDVAILVVFMLVTVSGIMVSRHILPMFGYVAPGYFFWNPVHSIAAKALLALLIIHIAAHARWIARLFKRRQGSA
jgi:hypothetical protein